jgi:parallel beta helix pectate lyase-like protein
LAGCIVGRLGGIGVKIDGGSRHGLLGCDIHTLGRHGTWVRGGDRKTLTPGRHFVENCHIHDFSRIDRAYTPAVWMDGVGNRIAHNLMHESPHHAMRIEGNDHVIEYNEVHSVCYETDDQAGLDMWFNASYRGVVIRHNFWHHIGSPLVRHGQAGIRLDDMICGVVMYGNVFYRSSGNRFGAIQIHGGKENVIDNNVFIDCRHAVSFSPWGKRRWLELLKNPRVVKKLTQEVDIRKPTYATRYPALARLALDPDKQTLTRNLVVRCGQFLLRDRGIHELIDNLVTSRDPGFVDAAKRDFRIRPDSPIYDRMALRPIPFGEIGLYQDAHRASWPVEHSITPHYTANPRQ